MRERLARLETAERAAEQGDYVVIDYVGSRAVETARRRRPPRAVRGRRGPRPARRARRRQPDPGLRGGAARRRGGRERDGRAHVPGRLRRERARRARRDLRGHRQGGQAQGAARTSTRTSRSTRASTTSRSCARTSRGQLVSADEERVEAGVPPGRARRGRRPARRCAVTPELVKARAKEMWERMLHSLSHRGHLARGATCRSSGDPRQELLAELEPEAERALRREAVITAIVAAEEISPSDEELLAALAPTAEREGVEPREAARRPARGRAPGGGARGPRRAPGDRPDRRAAPSRSRSRRRRRARQLWTPEKAAAGRAGEEGAGDAGSRLWTPDR